jgi:hypothetical protein
MTAKQFEAAAQDAKQNCPGLQGDHRHDDQG